MGGWGGGGKGLGTLLTQLHVYYTEGLWLSRQEGEEERNTGRSRSLGLILLTEKLGRKKIEIKKKKVSIEVNMV